MRTSTGVELQVMMPVVNAPFRLYWAYNPQIVQTVPAAAGRAGPFVVPQSGDVRQRRRGFGAGRRPFFEKRTTFRFSIGRTF